MKKMTIKVLGVFMTLFAVSGISNIDRVHATTPEISANDNSSFETDKHSGGCCCASCTQPTKQIQADNQI